jgi:hypothetical protein
VTFSPEARAAYEAFMVKREGIADRFRAELAGREGGEDQRSIAPVAPDRKAAIAMLTETGSKLSEDFQKARESFRASDRAKALAEVMGPSRDESGGGRSASRIKEEESRFGADKGDPFGSFPRGFQEAAGSRDRSRFGEHLGAERVRFATAFQTYERVAASTPARGKAVQAPRVAEEPRS